MTDILINKCTYIRVYYFNVKCDIMTKIYSKTNTINKSKAGFNKKKKKIHLVETSIQFRKWYYTLYSVSVLLETKTRFFSKKKKKKRIQL